MQTWICKIALTLMCFMFSFCFILTGLEQWNSSFAPGSKRHFRAGDVKFAGQRYCSASCEEQCKAWFWSTAVAQCPGKYTRTLWRWSWTLAFHIRVRQVLLMDSKHINVHIHLRSLLFIALIMPSVFRNQEKTCLLFTSGLAANIGAAYVCQILVKFAGDFRSFTSCSFT